MARLSFQNGMLGVTVVVIALAVAIIGSWALSTDIEDTEVTRYNPIADISGLFEGTLSPEYIEYSPTTNYTGYYTDDSTINSTHYFDGVDYTEASRANQYKLNLAPDSVYDDTVTLSDYSGTYPFDDEDVSLSFVWIDSSTGYTRGQVNTTATVVSLSSYIAAMDSDISGANSFTLRSTAELDSSDFTYGVQSDVDWVLLTTKSQWWKSNSQYNCVVGTSEYISSMGLVPGGTATNGAVLNLPFLSVSVDLSSGLATLYTDNDCTDAFGVYSLSDILLVYGGSNSGHSYWNLGDSAEITALSIETSYMDPSKGVSLS